MATYCKLTVGVDEFRCESSIQGFEEPAKNMCWDCTALEDGAQAKPAPVGIVVNKQALYGGARVM